MFKEGEMITMYVPQKSFMTVSGIFHYINGIRNHWPSLQPMDYYRRLLEFLLDRYGLEGNFLAKEALEKKPTEGFILQHDVDVSIISALEMARIEKQYGVRSTFYILHNVCYYGFWGKGVFYRHDAMIHVYRELQDLGHEVGIHIDPLDLIQNRFVDGKQAVIEEIRWLRENGINVVSMMPHNSPVAYGGIGNDEIFRGRNTKGVIDFDGIRIQLGDVDEQALGIKCMAYDPIEQLGAVYSASRYDRYYLATKTSDPPKKPRYISWSDYKSKIKAANNLLIVSAHPYYYRHEIKPEITLVHVLSLTKTGTTLLLMLLGTDFEHRAFALGHATKFYRDIQRLAEICMYHRPHCQFWENFQKIRKRGENSLLEVARYTGAEYIFGENFQFEADTQLAADCRDPRVEVKTIFNIRDGRGVCASYKRINPHLPFESVVKWYHHAITHWQPPEGAFVVRYEDVMADPLTELNRIGEYLGGLKYNNKTLANYNKNKHQISGNVHATGSSIIAHDERWKTELTHKDLKLFDKYCGEINASYGYY